MNMLQSWKVKLVYIGFGTVFGCLCTIIGMLASPVTAQRDKFGEIECTSLRVVDEDGVPRVEIAVSGGDCGVIVIDKDGVPKADLSVDEHHGGYVGVYDKTGKSAALRVGIYGGRVAVNGKDEQGALLSVDEHGGFLRVEGKDREPKAGIGVTEHGGSVRVYGKDRKSKVALGVTEHGGLVGVSGKGGKAGVALGVTEHGGSVSVFGKDEGEARAGIGISERGEGLVITDAVIEER